jgi:hypothetical protein
MRVARAGLFYLPDRDLLVRSMTVREHLSIVAQRRRGAAHIEPAIDELDLGPLLDRLPHTLSRGEARRTEVAIALVRAPSVLLADEPLLGLAPIDVERDRPRIAPRGRCRLRSRHQRAPDSGAARHCRRRDMADGRHDSRPRHADDAPEHWAFRQEYLGGRAAGTHLSGASRPPPATEPRP